MKKIRIYNRNGVAEFIAWDFDPEKNPDAKEKAYKKLLELGITGNVWEVAPMGFWYSVSEKKFNFCAW